MGLDIDVTNYLNALERLLEAGSDPEECQNAVAILQRWQEDHQLTESSRRRAGALLRRFASQLP